MKLRTFLMSGVFVVAVAIGAFYWWQQRQSDLPDGLVRANGRIEAERVDVALKFGGRIAEVLADEGQMVARGDVVARIDSTELEADIRAAEAAARQVEQELAQAKALVAQREGEVTLAQAELKRTETLIKQGYATGQTLDQRRSQEITAIAALNTARAQIASAKAAIEASEAKVAALKANLADYTLIAPRDGRVQYRLAQPGEVLAAGGKIITLLDLTDVYMDVYLPTDDAGRLRFGAEARLILDAAPQYVIPASVEFVASEAQFTPKYVETESERAKLTFRVKLQIPVEVLRKYQEVVKTGVPGVAIVRVSPEAEWPETLTVKLP
ncbi:HlyD family efflux transporter periplasmic adaptor subunit [Sneathiella sp.]|uniref:HlyD family secretion protein n=1 Tax=Sneathiella sp. TaxID=1964365 RepID=UPI002634EDAE|nr:HlyD family efflux transporter periplasmic adaptor subunit [Sneathiella sp.]MDF2368175.1 HlyD family efflux transporter periplasmic adaptor subunit [Sneathiella sp.]